MCSHIIKYALSKLMHLIRQVSDRSMKYVSDKPYTILNLLRHEQWDFLKSEEEGNTGFYYVRSNWRTIQLWKDTMSLASSPM
jgi:hypothetical protein